MKTGRRTGVAVAFLSLYSAMPASGAEPELKTPAPFIYLADNLDEKDKLGWCIDTVGRGLGEQLHAHSCKPQGGDVQFIHEEETGQIASVAFEGKCMTLNAPENEAIPFGLLDCTSDDSQKFIYDVDTMQFRPANDETMCVAVAPTSRAAGPFMSRDLKLSICAETDPTLNQWQIKSN